MNKIDNIANFLNKKSKKCLAINGPWGVGKTHLWKQIEKKLSKVNKDKKVVYIDLFGKESYKQILEEIVFKIHGNYNKIMNTFSQITTKIAKIKSAGTININPDAIFSFLKKEDFNNIIVCFDNIERRSDNLSLKEILGLVNLLKEEKECNVVMIFHKGELEEQDNNSAINDKEVQNIIFECYQNSCNNLRLLLRFVEHIIYFNKECFMKIKKEDYSNEIFFGGLKMYYDILLNCIKKYYSYNTDKKQYQSIFEKYFDDSCYLNQDDLDTLKSHFESDLKEKTRIYFNKCKDKYLYSNLNDIDFAKYIEDLLPKFKNYTYGNGTYYSISYYQAFFELYRRIMGKELDRKKDIEKKIIKELVEYEFDISIWRDTFHNDFYKEIKDMIEKNEEYKNYYQELQSKKHKNINIDSFLNGLSSDKIRQTFSTNNIWQYNHFEIESIVKSFQTNNDFYHEFFIFFSSAMDAQMQEKYDLKNSLFQAYLNFLDLNENKIKKEEILKTLEHQEYNCFLLQILKLNILK
ncbi:AAA family ATPase [Campylobacter jejuni]|nr:hypothetical protein [Campylobacter jejuni]EAI3369521.1 hypothetical protein [Campylobacter jejuni]EAI5165234.1 hypothetical protein [Campylobacter jejuni]EAI7591661.1 hypothetical protein [Campylobacter jejuni]EAI8408941.1 hypothetical protein [Campylobacter jejuni]